MNTLFNTVDKSLFFFPIELIVKLLNVFQIIKYKNIEY